MDIEYGDTEVTKQEIKEVTFDAGAGTGAIGDVPLFTVTGSILLVSLVPVCTTSLTETGVTVEMSLGITDSVSLFIAITEPEDINATNFWFDATPSATFETLPAGFQDIVINGTANDILATVTNDSVATGVLSFSLVYIPLTTGASAVTA